MEQESTGGILGMATLFRKPEKKDFRECPSEEEFERIAAELGSLPDTYELH